MIARKTLNKIYHGTCSIGFLTVPIDQYLKKPLENVSEIVGTGFLVRHSTVMTNRHVINSLMDARVKNELSNQQFFVRFIHPWKNAWIEHSYVISQTFVMADEKLDIGFIEFERPIDDPFTECKPLKVIDNLRDIYPGQAVGIIGFPFGKEALVAPFTNDTTVYRFGPILQQGYISAIAPFNLSETFTKVLLDIRTDNGMSGAAVFRSDNGDVLAIHEGGRGATMAFAIPFNNLTLKEWLKISDNTESDNLPDLTDQLQE